MFVAGAAGGGDGPRKAAPWSSAWRRGMGQVTLQSCGMEFPGPASPAIKIKVSDSQDKKKCASRTVRKHLLSDSSMPGSAGGHSALISVLF